MFPADGDSECRPQRASEGAEGARLIWRNVGDKAQIDRGGARYTDGMADVRKSERHYYSDAIKIPFQL